MMVAKLVYSWGTASGANGCLKAKEEIGRVGLQSSRASSSMDRWYMAVLHFVFQVTRQGSIKTEGRHSVFNQNA